ncbi:MAG: NAD(P)/FAD-dependent oxidoreductase [Actinomycetota bacterium]|nr:NAD(P)/FAD-dependent oxidoreductase [Actinomycetota bacterium]
MSGDTTSSEVLVVGAGPAGTAAAATLARAGVDVTVLDRATFPRDKCCGDGLTADALRRLEELGLDPATVPSWMAVDEVTITAPSGRRRVFPLPDAGGSYAVVARRAELDAALVDLARDAGARVIEGRTCVAVDDAERDTVSVTTDDATVHTARWLVAADGAWSPVRRHLGIAEPGYRGEWYAARQYFVDVGPQAASELHVWFEPELLPGYVWSFPLADGTANVGFGILTRGSIGTGDMAQWWDTLLARPHIRSVLGERARAAGRMRAWPIPARLGAVELTAGRVLFVGDAAAATDPMSGEGIAQALATGTFAAEAIAAEPGAAADVVGARYRRHVERDMGADHALADRLSRLLSARAGAELALTLVGANGWTRRNFARWLFEDYPRAAVMTPRRWRASTFPRRGAFSRIA